MLFYNWCYSKTLKYCVINHRISLHFPHATDVCRFTVGCLILQWSHAGSSLWGRKPKTQITVVKFSCSVSPEACDRWWDGVEEISGRGEDGEGWAPSEGVKLLI